MAEGVSRSRAKDSRMAANPADDGLKRPHLALRAETLSAPRMPLAANHSR